LTPSRTASSATPGALATLVSPNHLGAIGGASTYHGPADITQYYLYAGLLLLGGFAAGSVALTGTEAIANGVQAFKPPEPRNAAATLTAMAVLLAVLFVGITFVADSFGLVEISRSFSTISTLVVTPRIFELPRATAQSSWLGEGDGGMRTISAIGEDDAAPRQYQDGDGLHRVHWKSTARYGELMVRREEHQWRNSASVFLDTRRAAHAGTGPASTFEFAVSAAASIGAHLSGEGFRARLITEAGEIAPRGAKPLHAFEDRRTHHRYAAAGLRFARGR
jgi:hypothetical protein